MTSITRHASSLAINGVGILIEGPSGSGKTSLMFGLLERLLRAGLNAAMISDDYTSVSLEKGALQISAPDQIAGKAEVRGFGIVEVDHIAAARPIVVVSLTPDEDVERMPEPASAVLLGVSLPVIRAPRRHEESGVRIVLAWLREHGGVNLPFPAA